MIPQIDRVAGTIKKFLVKVRKLDMESFVGIAKLLESIELDNQASRIPAT
ncbi:hypothetical protein QUA56_15175 [Microcoleus sp. N3A4]